MFGRAVFCAALALLDPAISRAQEASQGEGDPYVLAVMNDFNRTLRAEWMDLRVQVEQIELLAVGGERSGGHLHREPFRWVPNDPRRGAATAVAKPPLTYRIDLSEGLGSIGQSAAETEAAVDRAMATWGSDSCFKKVSLFKRPDDGADADLFDSLFGYGSFGDYRVADVVHAGWLPPDFFEQVAGPGGGESVVALSVTFIFVGLDGAPTDLDRDGYMDAAHSEIYYNQGFAWMIDATAGQIDVESVALHEIGHALGIGHITTGSQPAVMNPVYSGQRTRLRPNDHAALCSIWASWGR